MDVYRSELYDIAEPEGRRGFLTAVIALTNYLLSTPNHFI